MYNVMEIIMKRRKNLSDCIVFTAFAIFVFSILQIMRHFATDKKISDIESRHVKGEKYFLQDGQWFNVYVWPLGVSGYYIFGSELFVVDSKGNKYVFLCDFYNKYKFDSHLRYLTQSGKRELYKSFDDLSKDDVLRQASRWKSPMWLGLLDALFVTLACACIWEIGHLIKLKGSKTKRGDP